MERHLYAANIRSRGAGDYARSVQTESDGSYCRGSVPRQRRWTESDRPPARRGRLNGTGMARTR